MDLRGLKAALVERAHARGMSPSDLVRRLLAEALGAEGAPSPPGEAGDSHGAAGRVRLSIRLTASEARALADAARAAELPVGAFLVRRLAVNALPAGDGQAGTHRVALTASCAELASLTRALRHLTELLRQGAVQEAVAYRAALDNAAEDIRTHLRLASQVLDELRPDLRRAQAAQRRRPATSTRDHP